MASHRLWTRWNSSCMEEGREPAGGESGGRGRWARPGRELWTPWLRLEEFCWGSVPGEREGMSSGTRRASLKGRRVEWIRDIRYY